MSRKKIEIDWVKLDSYLQFKASKKACAALLGISEDTIERNIKSKYKCTFTEYADNKLAPVKVKLVQKAITKALDGDNTMLIFCLKNICGWSDKVEQVFNQDPITVNVKALKKDAD